MDLDPPVCPAPTLSLSGGKPLTFKVNVCPSPTSSVFHRKQNLPIKLCGNLSLGLQHHFPQTGHRLGPRLSWVACGPCEFGALAEVGSRWLQTGHCLHQGRKQLLD